MTSVGRLQAELDRRADEVSRAWWSRHVNGTARFRGVKLEDVREVARDWWIAEEIGARSRAQQMRVVLDLFVEPMAEDKLAGVILLSEKLFDRLVPADVTRIGEVFAAGHIADANVCDRLCTEVLGPMIASADDPRTIALSISEWRDAPTVWQRRAACISFVPIAALDPEAFRGARALIIESCETVVRDDHSSAQTAVGWLLRELATVDRPAVARFSKKHAKRLSTEARQSLAEKRSVG